VTVHIEHQLSADHSRATIHIEGLQRDLSFLHITDSHIAAGDERDPDAAEHVTSVTGRFLDRTPGNVPPQKLFDEAVARGKSSQVDFAALTGDIIHFPSHKGVDIIREGMADLDVPYLYTPGNHDWHFPHLEWSNDTRAAHYPRFQPIAGDNPACQSLVVEGIRLIAIDNSNYQVSNEQVEFMRAELSHHQPSILLIHIPISIPSLTPAVMETWKAPIMMAASEGWTEQTREQWRVPADEVATAAFHDLIVSGDSENLAAIFCGHVHFDHVDEYRPGRYQYVTAPVFEGSSRLVELKAG